MIDVGSTGSRLHIFEIVKTSSSYERSRRDIQCLRRGSSKAWTALSAFASHHPSESDGNDIDNNNDQTQPLNATHVAHHMLPLFEYASIIIPHEFHSTTPVRIAATAGMRLLSLEDQSRVYDALHAGLYEQVENGRFTFTNLARKDVMTLNGEREAFYGAVAANYLRGVVDAELRVIVPPDEEETDSGSGDRQIEDNADNVHHLEGVCTNKFGMCEQDAEDVIFGPSHHYIPHDVKLHGPLGALDMGGSSTQIVYSQKAKEYSRTLGSNEETKEIESEDYIVPSHLSDVDFFSSSYLSYGVDQFRERLWDLWVSEAKRKLQKREAESNLPVIKNPCSFVGYQMSYKGFNLLGTGNSIQCAEQINRLIPHRDNAIDLDELFDENVGIIHSDESEEQPTTKRKMVGGVEHPPLRGKFYGMSLYFFTLDCLRELSDPSHPINISWPTPSIEELTHALNAFCARKWQGDLEEVQHEAHEHTRAEVLPHRCIEAVYMVTLLRDGFGFHPSSRDIIFAQWVEGNEVEWSLGMALSEFAAEKGRRSRI